MTIEEAIKELKRHISPYKNCKADADANEAIDTAIKSLEAWEKVRKEIKSLKPYFCNMDNEVISKSGEGIVQECIDIIDKHLAEVSE